MSRSAEFEQRWLRQIAGEAGYTDDDAFFRAVDARLAKGAGEYGDTFLDKPFTQLVAEASEEAADFPGWLVLAIQRFRAVEREQLPPAVADHIERTLTAAAARVLEAWHVTAMAVDLFDEYEAAPVPVAPPGKFYEE